MMTNYFKVLMITIIFLPVFGYAKEKTYRFKWMREDESLFVLQKKRFPKNNKTLITINYASNEHSDFQDSTGSGGDISYFFDENWGLSLGRLNYTNSNNESYESVSSQSNTFPFVRKIENRTFLNLMYTPFYGKFNAYNSIYYLDLSFGVGISQINYSDNLESFLNDANSLYKKQSELGYNMLIKATVNITKSLFISVEINRTYFNALRPREDKVEFFYNLTDVLYGAGFRF